MQRTYHARISPIGNSQGVRLPKVLAHALGTSDVILEQTAEGILIKPAPVQRVPPLREWDALFAKADTSPEPEWVDWEVTLSDGLDPWED